MEALATALAPGAAIVISILTLYLTQRRTQEIDNRSAAKDTVEILATQNEALMRELGDLRTRMTHMEQVLAECEHQRELLLHEVLALRDKRGGTDAPKQ